MAGSLFLALRNAEGSSVAVVNRCQQSNVPCAPDEDESCEECVLRLRAIEREEVRIPMKVATQSEGKRPAVPGESGR